MNSLTSSSPGSSTRSSQSAMKRSETIKVSSMKELEPFFKIKKASTAIEKSAWHIPVGTKSTLSEFDIWYLSVAYTFIKKVDLDLIMQFMEPTTLLSYQKQ